MLKLRRKDDVIPYSDVPPWIAKEAEALGYVHKSQLPVRKTFGTIRESLSEGLKHSNSPVLKFFDDLNDRLHGRYKKGKYAKPNAIVRAYRDLKTNVGASISDFQNRPRPEKIEAPKPLREKAVVAPSPIVNAPSVQEYLQGTPKRVKTHKPPKSAPWYRRKNGFGNRTGIVMPTEQALSKVSVPHR